MKLTFDELDCAAYRGTLSQFAGGVTAAQLAASACDTGWTALHSAADACHLNQIKHGVTVADLANVRERLDGWTGLHSAAKRGCLYQIRGGATAQDLIGVRDNNGWSGLHSAIYNEHLDQIQGGVTAQQLIDARDNKGESALLWCSQIDLVQDGVTWEQLASVRDDHGYTGLHCAAEHSILCLIRGGVTATQLAAVTDHNGKSALATAVIATPFAHVRGGIPRGLLAQVDLDHALELNLQFGAVNAHELIELGADKRLLPNAVTVAADQALANPSDYLKIHHLRDLLHLAAGVGVDVSVNPEVVSLLL